MPTNDFTSKLLEMEDVLVNDITSSDTELHISFSLKRKPHTCPHCSNVTEQIHDYRTSIIKIPVDKSSMQSLLMHIITNFLIYCQHAARLLSCGIFCHSQTEKKLNI